MTYLLAVIEVATPVSTLPTDYEHLVLQSLALVHARALLFQLLLARREKLEDAADAKVLRVLHSRGHAVLVGRANQAGATLALR